MGKEEDVKIAIRRPRQNTPPKEVLEEYRDENFFTKLDDAKWGLVHKFNKPLTGELKLVHLRIKDPVLFYSLIKKWENPYMKDGEIIKETAQEQGIEDTRKVIPVPFTREFYTAMKESGYTKFDPEKLAKVYERLHEIATADFVEPRDNIAAAKVVLQYNDMDVAQMQKQNKDLQDEEAMSEVKRMVSGLKQKFKKAETVEVEAIDED